MAADSLNNSVFINCPFDSEFFPLLEALCFCVSYLGFTPRLANERLEAGENRLDKILELVAVSRYSIHDLSRCKASESNEFFRMNMPFELGVDFGFRKSPGDTYRNKKFLIFEENQYDLKRSLSDLAGTDVEFHEANLQKLVRHTRNFFKVEAEVDAPGPMRIIGDYATFQGWLMEKKLFEGHSEEDAKQLPISERLEEMRIWIELSKPAEFIPNSGH